MPTYSATGPFTNGTTPAVSASFLNAMENWILGMDDANVNVTSGATVNCHTVNFQVGGITRIAFGFSSVTTGGTTITHNLGAIPSGVFVQVSGVSATTFVTNYSATNTMTITSVGSNCNVWWLVIA